MKTHTITQVSGPNTDASSGLSGKSLGDLFLEITKILKDDPYWPICLALYRLLSRKRGYYGCKENPLSNALGVQEDGIVPWKYQIARVGEKCRRLRGTLETFDIRETLLDIAGHAVVGVACLNHEDTNESQAAAVADRTP